MHLLFFIFIFVIILVRPLFARHEPPKVEVTQGTIIGTYDAIGKFNVFYGIPYAGSTSGSNRFKAPTEAPNFYEEFQATDPSKHCLQATSDGLVGEEDCLVLDIYTKNISGHQPVIVWLDGDEYMKIPDNTGYSFNKFMAHDVVMVSINYRLSVFGFLCLGIEEAPGNAGLKDVIAGLNWIYQNIGQFGGDSNNVMIFGHGSGGAMADLITLSPLGKGLVHKVIAASGTSLAPWAVAYDPEGYAFVFGQKLGFKGKSRKKLARFLIKTEASILVEALQGFEFLNNTPLFAPCIENAQLKPTFLSEAPIDVIRSGYYEQIPFIAGYNNMEGTMRTKQAFQEKWLEKMHEKFEHALPVDISNRTKLASSVRKLYFGEKNINTDSIEEYFKHHGDTMIVVPTIRTVEERHMTSAAPVRLYEFSYKGTKQSELRNSGVKVTGAHYRSILDYLFDSDMDEFDDYAQEALIGRWIGFAYNGNPINASTSQPEWEPVMTGKLNYLLIKGDREAPMHTFQEISSVNPHPEKYPFWKKLYALSYVKPLSFNGCSRENVFSLTLYVLLIVTFMFYIN